ncbi:MAG: HD domain-containing protein [Actinomycetota bacterium]
MTSHTEFGPKAAFTAMERGTAQDWALIDAHTTDLAAGQADRVLGWLEAMDGPSPYQVSRLEHSLQSATRAEADGAELEMIVAALVHDVGDEISPHNHSEVGAAIIRPYVSDRTHWIVKHHGLFQGYYWMHHYGQDRNERDRHHAHEWYDACVHFCAEWDQNCFDPSFVSAPLSYFEPLVRDVFARPPHNHV